MLEELEPRLGDWWLADSGEKHAAAFIHDIGTSTLDVWQQRRAVWPHQLDVAPLAHLHRSPVVGPLRAVVVVLGRVEEQFAAWRDVKMNRRSLLWSAVAIVALVLAGTIARAAETLHIVPVHHDGHVLVSVEVNDLNVAEVRDVIASGLRTTFTYDIELKMVVPAWVDPTIAAATAAISDQYDNLTRQHRLSKAIDGRVVETLVTVDEHEAYKWLTTLSRVPLCETAKLDPNRDYYVRISTRERPRRVSLFGWGPAITGQAKFTFIP
jgi:hypothetical protein